MKKAIDSESSLVSMASEHCDRSVRINMEPDDVSQKSSTPTYKKRQSIAPVVQEHLNKIKQTHGVGSIERETKHFCNNTTMHGPKRIYFGKDWARLLWLLVFLGSWGFLILQIVILTTSYWNKPTTSQVSFYVDEEGIPFPAITVCNFNPAKASNVQALNSSGDFPYGLLDYVMESNMDAAALFSAADRNELRRGDALLKAYQKIHPNFSFYNFFDVVGFNCEDIMMTCTFGGRNFSCCQYATPVQTNMGKCFKLNLQTGPEWLRKQISAGVDSGLQLILDARQDEQMSQDEDEDNSYFSTSFENGFRFFVHNYDREPNPSIEGISVSPRTRVYTALSVNQYHLLEHKHYGNCSSHWPDKFQSHLSYSTINCETICRAQFFNDSCGCSPGPYNLDKSFRECTPLETVTCMDEKMKTTQEDGTVSLGFPLCTECKVECNSVLYNAFNSYGAEFNPGSVKWLAKHSNYNRTNEHIRKNFLTVNVFFRDLTHVEYSQEREGSIAELLSNIGGNMGMFLGMSLITIAEALMYLIKISWIAISRKRREYMYTKKVLEKEQNQEIQETVKTFRLYRASKVAPAEENCMDAMKNKIQAISLNIDELDEDKTRQPSEDSEVSGIYPI